jgi:hypothetical protein
MEWFFYSSRAEPGSPRTSRSAFVKRRLVPTRLVGVLVAQHLLCHLSAAPAASRRSLEDVRHIITEAVISKHSHVISWPSRVCAAPVRRALFIFTFLNRWLRSVAAEISPVSSYQYLDSCFLLFSFEGQGLPSEQHHRESVFARHESLITVPVCACRTLTSKLSGLQEASRTAFDHNLYVAILACRH